MYVHSRKMILAENAACMGNKNAYKSLVRKSEQKMSFGKLMCDFEDISI
jgi:hypothetical protein